MGARTRPVPRAFAAQEAKPASKGAAKDKPAKGKAKGKAKAKKDDGPSVDEVREALRRVIDKGGNPAATEILEEFGVKKVSGLKPLEYSDVIEAAEKYLDSADDDEDGGLLQ